MKLDDFIILIKKYRQECLSAYENNFQSDHCWIQTKHKLENILIHSTSDNFEYAWEIVHCHESIFVSFFIEQFSYTKLNLTEVNNGDYFLKINLTDTYPSIYLLNEHMYIYLLKNNINMSEYKISCNIDLFISEIKHNLSIDIDLNKIDNLQNQLEIQLNLLLINEFQRANSNFYNDVPSKTQKKLIPYLL